MGLGIVLLFWAIAGLAVAGLGVLICGSVAESMTRGVAEGRKKIVRAAKVLPIACLAWAGTIFILQAVVNAGFLKRDIGMGDAGYCPLPNGYEIMMIDVTDQGAVYNPKTQASSGGVVDQHDAVLGARTLQVDGRYVLGGMDSKAFQHAGQDSDDIDSYFLLDTATGTRTQFTSYEELKAAAKQFGIPLRLEPIYTVYSRYRFTWFDLFAVLLLCIPPILAVLLIGYRIMRLRRTRLVAIEGGVAPSS